jgi:hypothetical protein
MAIHHFTQLTFIRNDPRNGFDKTRENYLHFYKKSFITRRIVFF